MNRKQWYVLGIGLFLFGWFLEKFAMFCGGVSGDLLTACYVQRYSFTIPGLISAALGVLFVIMGFLEPKKKEDIAKKEEDEAIREMVKYIQDSGGIDKFSNKANKNLTKGFSKDLRKKYPNANIWEEDERK